MTSCWFCGCQMIWMGDASFSDHVIEEEGTVVLLECDKCNCVAEFRRIENDES